MKNYDVPPRKRSLEMEQDNAQPSNTYFSIQQDQFVSTITIPVKKSPVLIIIFFSSGFVFSGFFFLMVWFFFNSPDFGILIFVVLTAFGALVGVFGTLQQFTGKVIVQLRNDEMEISKWIAGMSSRRIFRRNEIRDLKVIRVARDSEGEYRDGFDRLSFSYFGKTHSFGYSADLGAADEVHSFLCSRLPNASPRANT